jgi:hypothetical protein
MEPDPLHALLRQAFCAHVWLMDRLATRLEAVADPRAERVRYHKEYAEHLVQDAAQRMGEPDPFLPMPAAPADDAAGWYDLGFSALLLELVTLNARSLHLTAGGEAGDTSYGACGEHFAMTRRYAFHQAADEGDAAIAERLKRFEIPAVEAWGPDFLKEAVATLDGRLSRRAVLKQAVATLKAHGLPEDPWRYIEPVLDRHGKAFGVGWVKKKAIKAALWLA